MTKFSKSIFQLKPLNKMQEMETVPVDTVPEEREEGEIVEDELEDVSDCSMSPGSPLYFGKSVSPPELLSAVCLSSVSSSEYSAGDGRCRVRDVPFSYYGKKEVRRRLHKRKRKLEDHSLKRKHCRHVRHNRKPAGDSDTDSVTEVVDPKYAKKLRVALRRESSQDLLHNSLRTRLKAFIEPTSQEEDELNLNALRDLALLSTSKNAENSEKPVDHESAIEIVDESKTKSNKPDDEGKEHLPPVNQNSQSTEIQSADESKQIDNLDEDELSLKLLNNAESQSGESDDQIFENIEKIDDSELHELRMAALKSFVIDNHNRRKEKAAQENRDKINSDNNNKEDASDIDKENDKSMINNDLDGKSSKKSENNSEVVTKQQPIKVDNSNGGDGNCTDCIDSLEDDADILRAMLLASMSKRLAGQTVKPNSPTNAFPRTLSELRKAEKSKMNHNSLSVTITKPLFKTIKNDLYTITNTNNSNLLKNKNITDPSHLPPNIVVKPLIINVNADSDSDTENFVCVNESNKALKATVTEFLKKQRAEVEATVKKKTPDSPDSTFSNKSDDPLMDKSVMRLLPKSQQIEYRRLKQQLEKARKRLRVRRHSQKLSESKRENVTNIKKVPKLKTVVTTNSSAATNGRVVKNSQEKKNIEPANLQKALNELQIRKNGRLQMKGKYRSLAPLLHRINQASNERRQHEIEIKKLLQQIQKARTKLASSHQTFTSLVQQLLREKNTIDQRVFKITKVPQVTPLTSTPNNLVKKRTQTCDISFIKDNNSVVEKEILIDSTKISNNTQPVEHKSQNTINETEGLESTVQNDIQVLQKEEMLLEPNDITKVFVDIEQPIAEFPKYTSPLDNRDGINDPLTTVCPYDLLGVCKDKECLYMHCT